MKKRLSPILIIVTILSFVAVAGAIAFSNMGRVTRGSDTQVGGHLPVYGKLSPAKLIERSGRSVDFSELKGKVLIADFIFTRCAGVCPMMSGYLRGIQEKVKKNEMIQLVSVSVDPDYDTPEVLSKYAKRYEADPERWLFFTGAREVVYDLIQKAFRLGVSEIPEDEREQFDQAIRHSSKFVLIDAKGQIRGYYDTQEQGNLDQIVKDAQLLAGT